MQDESIQIKKELEDFKAALSVKAFKAIDDGIGIGRIEVENLIPESVKARFASSDTIVADHRLANEMELYRPKTDKNVWKPLSSARGMAATENGQFVLPKRSRAKGNLVQHTRLSLWNRLLVFSLDFSLVTLTSLVAIISYRLFGDHNEALMRIVKLPLEAFNMSPSLSAPIIMLILSVLVYLMYKVCLTLIMGRTLGENILTRLLEQ
jgi:hypothetical protein